MVALASSIYKNVYWDIYMTAERHQESGTVIISNKGTQLSFKANDINIYEFIDFKMTLPVEFKLVNNGNLDAYVEFKPDIKSGNSELLDTVAVLVNDVKINKSLKVAAGTTENVVIEVTLQVTPWVDITNDNNEISLSLSFEALNEVSIPNETNNDPAINNTGNPPATENVPDQSVKYVAVFTSGLLLAGFLLYLIMYIKRTNS